MRYYLSLIHNRNCTISIHGLHASGLQIHRYSLVEYNVVCCFSSVADTFLLHLLLIHFTVGVYWCVCVCFCIFRCFHLSFYDTLWRSFVLLDQFCLHFHRSTWANDSIYFVRVCTLVAELIRRFVVNTIKLMQWHEKKYVLGWSGKWKWTTTSKWGNPIRRLWLLSFSFICSLHRP